MRAKLFTFDVSHPGHGARLMLEHKGVEVEPKKLLPGFHPIQLKLYRFEGPTAPAILIDGRRIQTTRAISRALEELVPEPPLFPSDPTARARVEEAELWGDEVFQSMPRRAFRRAAAERVGVRRYVAESAGIPAPGLAAATGGLSARILARQSGATDDQVKRDIRDLPGALDHVDGLIAEGVIGGERRNAADFQIFPTVRTLTGMPGYAEMTEGRACARLARELLPEFPGPTPELFPREWLNP